MPALNFLPLATDAWLADTGHLTRAERGLYHDLLVLMWRTPECRVPNDIAWIARKLRCSEDEIDMLKAIVSEFCTSSGNWLTQKRLKTEWQRALASVEKQRARAKARWDNGKGACHGNATLHLSGNAPTPTPTPTYYSVSKDTADGAVSADPAKVVFDAGVRLLREAGKSDGQARALVGRWRRDHGDEALIAALGRAQREGAIDPVAFVEGCLRANRRAKEEGGGVARVGF